MSWVDKLLANFAHAPQVAKRPEPDPRDLHSELLRRRADRVYADLQAVRRIEIIVRRR